MAGGFVQKNNSQFKKNLISPKRLANPIVLTEFDDTFKPDFAMAAAAEQAIEKIISEYGVNTSILIIGRYNYDNYKICRTGKFNDLPGNRILCEKFPNANITFMTAHSAKGFRDVCQGVLLPFHRKVTFPNFAKTKIGIKNKDRVYFSLSL